MQNLIKKVDPVETIKQVDVVPDNDRSKPQLRQMKTTKQLCSKVSLYGQIDEFLQIEKKKLNVDDENNLYLNTKVLQEIMQDCEYHFVYGKNEEERQMLKDEAILRLMLVHFDNNENVLNRFKQMIYKKISRYGYFRRLTIRVFNMIFKKRLM